MLYTPLLPEAGAGSLEPRHVVVPIREMCPHAELLLGSATGLDEERAVVAAETLAGPVEIAYERLVVALGAVPRTLPIPGLAEHGVGFKDLADAIALRNRLLLQLERASIKPDDPVGARLRLRRRRLRGRGGARRAERPRARRRSATTPRYATSRSGGCSSTRRRRSCPRSRDGSGSTPRSASPSAAWRSTSRRRSSRTTGRKPSSRTESAFPARTLVWSAGVRASPLLGELGLPLDERGRVVVDEYLRVRERESVWALGDCAAVPNRKTPGRSRPADVSARAPPGAAPREELHG